MRVQKERKRFRLAEIETIDPVDKLVSVGGELLAFMLFSTACCYLLYFYVAKTPLLKWASVGAMISMLLGWPFATGTSGAMLVDFWKPALGFRSCCELFYSHSIPGGDPKVAKLMNLDVFPQCLFGTFFTFERGKKSLGGLNHDSFAIFGHFPRKRKKLLKGTEKKVFTVVPLFKMPRECPKSFARVSCYC